jgi:hypothetical protein
MNEHRRTSTTAAEAEWFVLNDNALRRLPEWRRSACLVKGEVYLPATIAGIEGRVLHCAAFDGVGIIQDSGHIFVPASWMRQEYPDLAEVIDKLAGLVRERATKEED